MEEACLPPEVLGLIVGHVSDLFELFTLSLVSKEIGEFVAKTEILTHPSPVSFRVLLRFKKVTECSILFRECSSSELEVLTRPYRKLVLHVTNKGDFHPSPLLSVPLPERRRWGIPPKPQWSPPVEISDEGKMVVAASLVVALGLAAFVYMKRKEEPSTWSDSYSAQESEYRGWDLDCSLMEQIERLIGTTPFELRNTTLTEKSLPSRQTSLHFEKGASRHRILTLIRD